MRNPLIKTLVILLFTAPMYSSALVYNGSNLKNDEYQRFENPPLDPGYDDKDSINEHRKKVADYLRRAEMYVENADSDIKRIQSNRADAIQRARTEAEKYDLKTNLPPG
ncbi:TPA: hypothetical protein RK230_003100 [Enterobacter asburiae]|nr:hypothetical protein [Enterobacter asburiae]